MSVLAAIPAGFEPVPAPTQDELLQANLATDEYRVRLDAHGAVAAARTRTPEASTGPELPFEVRPLGRRHVLPVEDGFLVAFDAGEWGGSLAWYSKDGRRSKVLAADNCQGVFAQGAGYTSFHGLNHLGLRAGVVRRWRRAADGFAPAGESALDSGPLAWTATSEVAWVLTADGLWKVTEGAASKQHQVGFGLLYPNSLVVDARGDVWVGARRYVIRLEPGAAGMTEHWLRKKRGERPARAR